VGPTFVKINGRSGAKLGDHTHGETKRGDLYLAKTGDPDLATGGDLFMVTVTCGGKPCGELPGQQWEPERRRVL
jgi:hypothetical protein